MSSQSSQPRQALIGVIDGLLKLALRFVNVGQAALGQLIVEGVENGRGP
jgi:hypothetical protein